MDEAEIGVIETNYRTRTLLSRINGNNEGFGNQRNDKNYQNVHFNFSMNPGFKKEKVEPSSDIFEQSGISEFWPSLARGEKTVELSTYFFIFDLPRNGQIYEWFCGTYPCSALYDFVSKFIDGQDPKSFTIHRLNNVIPNSEDLIKDKIRITGDDRKRMIFQVELKNKPKR